MHEYEFDFGIFSHIIEINPNIEKEFNNKCANCKYSTRTHGEEPTCMKSKIIAIDADEIHCKDYCRDTQASKYIKELPEALIMILPYLETLVETTDEDFEDMKGFINYFKNNIC